MYFKLSPDVKAMQSILRWGGNWGGGGGTREFEWNFKRFKKGIKEKILFLEHQQTVAPNQRADQVGRGLFGCPYINF